MPIEPDQPCRHCDAEQWDREETRHEGRTRTVVETCRQCGALRARLSPEPETEQSDLYEYGNPEIHEEQRI